MGHTLGVIVLLAIVDHIVAVQRGVQCGDTHLSANNNTDSIGKSHTHTTHTLTQVKNSRYLLLGPCDQGRRCGVCHMLLLLLLHVLCVLCCFSFVCQLKTGWSCLHATTCPAAGTGDCDGDDPGDGVDVLASSCAATAAGILHCLPADFHLQYFLLCTLHLWVASCVWHDDAQSGPRQIRLWYNKAARQARFWPLVPSAVCATRTTRQVVSIVLCCVQAR